MGFACRFGQWWDVEFPGVGRFAIGAIRILYRDWIVSFCNIGSVIYPFQEHFSGTGVHYGMGFRGNITFCCLTIAAMEVKCSINAFN